MAKNWKWYIENEDLDGVFERYESTTKQWKDYWFDIFMQIAETAIESVKKYIVIVEDKAIYEKVKVKRVVTQLDIETNGLDLLKDVVEKCYLFRFFDEEKNLICSKVGTTKRKVLTRLREEMRSDTYKKMGVKSATIDRVYDCHNYPAEGLESFFRALYIKEYPNSFKKNDRFIEQEFDLEKADKIVKTYFNIML